MHRLLSLAVWLCAGSLVAAEKPGYDFKLNGEVVQPRILSLAGTPSAPQAGDVIEIDDLYLTLGEPGTYDLRGREDGRLLRVTPAGMEVIAVNVDFTYQGEDKVLLDPLAKLTAAEIGKLRGVRLNVWTPAIQERLKHINPASTCLTVTQHTGQGPKLTLPPLPADLRYLRIYESSSEGFQDCTALKDQKQLRFLVMDGLTDAVDARLIRDATDLRYLNGRFRNVAELSALKQVRFLYLGGGEEDDSIACVRSMPYLVELQLGWTKVADLSPIEGLKSLARLKANGAPINKLPAGKVPALRRLEVMTTALTDEAVADFAKANPECRVLFRWEQALRDDLKGTTRIRVRSGGTCHRDIPEEKTLIDIKDAAQIAKLVEAIRIDEKQSGFLCGCCGWPSLEFYRENDLVLTLGFHHGHGLRWPGGWPGDARLADTSADALCRWLADHSVKQPLEEWNRTKKQQAAAKRRQDLYEQLVPEKVRAGLQKADSQQAAIDAFQLAGDARQQVILYLQLFGCDNGSWNHYSGLDDFIRDALLPQIGADQLRAVLAKTDDARLLNGAGRWLFGELKWKDLDAATQEALFPKVGGHALGHPRPFNRKQALAALGESRTTAGVLLLRQVLAGKMPPRPLPAQEETEPGGMIAARPGDDALGKGSDQAVAALFLARAGDRASAAQIRALAEKAQGTDRDVLQEAVKLLEMQ